MVMQDYWLGVYKVCWFDCTQVQRGDAVLLAGPVQDHGAAEQRLLLVRDGLVQRQHVEVPSVGTRQSTSQVRHLRAVHERRMEGQRVFHTVLLHVQETSRYIYTHTHACTHAHTHAHCAISNYVGHLLLHCGFTVRSIRRGPFSPMLSLGLFVGSCAETHRRVLQKRMNGSTLYRPESSVVTTSVQLSQPYVATSHTDTFISHIFLDIGML